MPVLGIQNDLKHSSEDPRQNASNLQPFWSTLKAYFVSDRPALLEEDIEEYDPFLGFFLPEVFRRIMQNTTHLVKIENRVPLLPAHQSKVSSVESQKAP